jgi:UV DNA damage endonuclease
MSRAACRPLIAFPRLRPRLLRLRIHSAAVPSALDRMAKRKRSSVSAASPSISAAPPKRPPPRLPPALKSSTAALSAPDEASPAPFAPSRRPSRRWPAPSTNPDHDPAILDGANALRASPDCDVDPAIVPPAVASAGPESDLSDALELLPPSKEPRGARSATAPKPAAKPGPQGDAVGVGSSTSRPAGKAATGPGKITCTEKVHKDPEAEGKDEDDEIDDADVEQAVARPPPVDSDYLPLPWKGRLGYVRLPLPLALAPSPARRSTVTDVHAAVSSRERRGPTAVCHRLTVLTATVRRPASTPTCATRRPRSSARGPAASRPSSSIAIP